MDMTKPEVGVTAQVNITLNITSSRPVYLGISYKYVVSGR